MTVYHSEWAVICSFIFFWAQEDPCFIETQNPLAPWERLNGVVKDERMKMLWMWETHDLLIQSVGLGKSWKKWTRNKKTTGREHMGWVKQTSENNLSTKPMKMQFKEAGYRNWKGVKRIMLLIAKEVGGVKLKGNMKKYSLRKCCH